MGLYLRTNQIQYLDTVQTTTAAKTFTGGITVNTLGMTITDVDIALSTGTGTKLGTATGQKIGFYNATPAIQQASAANLTNNVTVGGTNDQIDDFISLTVYATDAAAIRNDIYQLGRKLKQVNDGLRVIGVLS